MWIELSNTWIIVANVLGIPAAHMLVSWCCTNMPASWFAKPDTPHAPKPHPVYEKIFFIRRWKHLLPDAAPWMKGFPKGSLASTEPDYLREFMLETRRGEFAHWLQWLAISAFIIWNPYPANLVILFYAALANLPCILNLRYTRQRMARHLSKKVSA
ncbi:MAG: glycosyl-4,4'-diaponeurosporenoate acyltransferase [Akkermansiaceae bacterium]